MNTFRQVKTYLNDQTKVYFGSGFKPAEKTPKDFLKNFFDYNDDYNTVFANGKVQCESGARRSIGDIFRITQHYYPKVMLKTCYEAMIAQIAEGKVLSAICVATGLRVYHNDNRAFFNGDALDEFEVDISKIEGFPSCKKSSADWGYSRGRSHLKFIKID